MIQDIEVTKKSQGACKCCTEFNQKTYVIKFINHNRSQTLELCRTHLAILQLLLENLNLEEI